VKASGWPGLAWPGLACKAKGWPVYKEDDLLPISAIQHLAFCERQCALIYLEQIWDENRLTAEGKVLHERVHEADLEVRNDVRIVRGLRLRTLRLGLVGVADVVEFHRAADETGVRLPGAAGWWSVYPVEYKRGRPKVTDIDMVQLCAQALSIEEMLQTTVPEGAIFYGQPRRRQVVAVDSLLRNETARLAARLHDIMRSGITPPAVLAAHCQNCSLLDRCLPKVAARSDAASRYLDKA